MPSVSSSSSLLSPTIPTSAGQIRKMNSEIFCIEPSIAYTEPAVKSISLWPTALLTFDKSRITALPFNKVSAISYESLSKELAIIFQISKLLEPEPLFLFEDLLSNDENPPDFFFPSSLSSSNTSITLLTTLNSS